MPGPRRTRTLTRERLAAAEVDVVAVGNPAAMARELFAAYPQWRAAQTGTYTVVADGAFLGPLNAWAVEKFAKAVRPDA